jgi:hypothetical protein
MTSNNEVNVYPVIVCAGAQRGRAVLFGWVEEDPIVGKPVTLYHARMVVYWDSDCGGLLGLAARGPKGGTRITHAIPRTAATCQEWVEVTPEAAEGLDEWPAC